MKQSTLYLLHYILWQFGSSLSPFFHLYEKGASYLRCIWMICRINWAWLLGSFHQFHDMPRKTLTIMLLCLVHQSLSSVRARSKQKLMNKTIFSSSPHILRLNELLPKKVQCYTNGIIKSTFFIKLLLGQR